MTPDSSRWTLAARSASCWERKTALGAPSDRQCEPNENGRGSSRRLRLRRFGRLRRLTTPFWLGIGPAPHTLRGGWVAAARTANERPRRAMIRRRGKRGRIRRAEAAEAYENRTRLTNDTCKHRKKAWARGRSARSPVPAVTSAFHLIFPNLRGRTRLADGWPFCPTDRRRVLGASVFFASLFVEIRLNPFRSAIMDTWQKR